MNRDKTIRELQSSLPWTAHYHRDFRASPMTHKDFGHALLHVLKAGGKLAAIVNDAEHGGVQWNNEIMREKVGNYVADFVVCALRMANTCPEGVLDLQALTEARITNKNAELGNATVTVRSDVDLDKLREGMKAPTVFDDDIARAVYGPAAFSMANAKPKLCGPNQYRSMTMDGPCTKCGRPHAAHFTIDKEATAFAMRGASGEHGDEVLDEQSVKHVIKNVIDIGYWNHPLREWVGDTDRATIFLNASAARAVAAEMRFHRNQISIQPWLPKTFTEGASFTGRGEDCRNGHKPTLHQTYSLGTIVDSFEACSKCGKRLGHADGIHVHDPRNQG